MLVNFEKVKIHGLNWEKIFALDYYSFCEYKDFKKLYPLTFTNFNAVLSHCKEFFIKYLFYYPQIKQKNTQFLFFKSMERQDYETLFEKIYLSCDADKEFISSIKSKEKFNWVFLSTFFRNLPALIRLYNGALFPAIYFYLLLVKYLSILKIFERKLSFTSLVVFADMQSLDNMLVQYFKKRGKRTITLQHGLYVDYANKPNINVINYLNVSSDYFLAWGEETSSLIKKYHKNVNVIICGKPVLCESRLQGVFFTVLFDQQIYEPYNKTLLSIAYRLAEKLKLKILVKFHPKNIKSNYDLDEKYIIKDGNIYNSSFLIGHTTSMIYEMMRFGYPVFKLKSEEPCNYINPKLLFDTAEDIILILNNPIAFEEEGKYYLKYIGDESISKYKDFFLSKQRKQKNICKFS